MDMKKKIALFIILGLSVVLTALAATESEIKDAVSSYRKYMEISVPKLAVPTVIELAVPNNGLERYDFLVFDKTIKSFEPSLLLIDGGMPLFNISITDVNINSLIPNPQNIVDNNENSYAELPIFDDKIGSASIKIESETSIEASSLFFLLDNNVALPKTISIKTGSDLKTVLATTDFLSQTVHFPKTIASKWIIDITYGQPLRITELRLGAMSDQIKTSKLRFLAQPDHDYGVYLDPDRRVNIVTGERANLNDNTDVLKVGTGPLGENLAYVIADTDGDNVPDIIDNCVAISNTDQIDINNNGRGDVCDDFDKDGVINSLDNCPDLPNYNQKDTDGDKIGDICDNEEGRITEKYKWLPWVGMGFAALVVIGLFVITARSMKKKPDLPPQN